MVARWRCSVPPLDRMRQARGRIVSLSQKLGDGDGVTAARALAARAFATSEDVAVGASLHPDEAGVADRAGIDAVVSAGSAGWRQGDVIASVGRRPGVATPIGRLAAGVRAPGSLPPVDLPSTDPAAGRNGRCNITGRLVRTGHSGLPTVRVSKTEIEPAGPVAV